MVIVLIFLLISILAFGAATVCHIKKCGKPSFWLFAAAYTVLLVSAAAGADFSPSFTAIFLVVCFCLVTVSEGVSVLKCKNTVLIRSAGLASYVVAMLFLFPSVYIYEVGTDRLTFNCIFSFVCTVALTAIFAFILWKKYSKHGFFYAADCAELFFCIAAAVFTLVSARTSPALLTYGLGVALFVVSRFVGVKFFRNIFVYCGIVLSAFFLWAPMMF